MKHLKIQHLSNNPKNTAAVTSTPKNTDFRNSKPQKYLLISVCKYAKSTPWQSLTVHYQISNFGSYINHDKKLNEKRNFLDLGKTFRDCFPMRNLRAFLSQERFKTALHCLRLHSNCPTFFIYC